MAKTKLSKIINNEPVTESIMSAAGNNKKPKTHGIADDTYFSAIPSHKSESRFFTTMNDRVVVETFKGGAARATGRDQASRLEYMKRRFGKHILRASEVENSNPTDRKAKEEKIRQIRSQISDKRLADELIAKLG